MPTRLISGALLRLNFVGYNTDTRGFRWCLTTSDATHSIRHGRDMIKDEMLPHVTEYPGFILSMNAEPQSFPDEVVKRSMMIYTTTALPQHNEELRQKLQGRVQEMRRGLKGHLYRRYLSEIMDRADDERLPEDWLALSSGVLSSIFSEAKGGSTPSWCQASPGLTTPKNGMIG